MVGHDGLEGDHGVVADLDGGGAIEDHVVTQKAAIANFNSGCWQVADQLGFAVGILADRQVAAIPLFGVA